MQQSKNTIACCFPVDAERPLPLGQFVSHPYFPCKDKPSFLIITNPKTHSFFGVYVIISNPKKKYNEYIVGKSTSDRTELISLPITKIAFLTRGILVAS